MSIFSAIFGGVSDAAIAEHNRTAAAEARIKGLEHYQANIERSLISLGKRIEAVEVAMDRRDVAAKGVKLPEAPAAEPERSKPPHRRSVEARTLSGKVAQAYCWADRFRKCTASPNLLRAEAEGDLLRRTLACAGWYAITINGEAIHATLDGVRWEL